MPDGGAGHAELLDHLGLAGDRPVPRQVAAVNRLESAGLVTRKSDPTDRRTTLVELLDAGRNLAVAATEELNAKVFTSPGVSPAGVTSPFALLAEMRREAGDF